MPRTPKPKFDPEEMDLLTDTGDVDQRKIEMLYRKAKTWKPEEKVAMLRWVEQAANRKKITSKYHSAAEIARAVDPDFNITPAIQLIADDMELVLDKPRHNLVVTMPPQEGKSTLTAVWLPIRAWQKNPNTRIILASYNDDLAHAHSLACRDVIKRFGTDVIDPMTGMHVEDRLGLKLSPKSKRIDSWYIDQSKGGLLAVGLGSGATGRSADLFIIDDPYKNVQEADSAAHRAKVDAWLRTVAMTRLSPNASMILIQTRWHPEDLAGKIVSGELKKDREDRNWRYINIPAIAEKGIPDSLNRPFGEAMVSARGRTKKEFEDTRRNVGERTFYAMYQGSPRNPAGGLFERIWFDPKIPPGPDILAAVVGVDPADSGEGDHTGILAGVLEPVREGELVGRITFTRDESGMYTSDKWAVKAIHLALETGARAICLEGFSTWNTYRNTVKSAWKELQRDVSEKLAAGKRLTELEMKLLSPAMPFMITKYTEQGDAVARSALLRQQLEVGQVRVVPEVMDAFIDQAADWNPGQHCPDRVSAAVLLHDALYKIGTGTVDFTDPTDPGGASSPWDDWLSQKVIPGQGGFAFGR